MTKQSKADEQTIRDEADATSREAVRQTVIERDHARALNDQRQADHELEMALNRADAMRKAGPLTWWQRFKRAIWWE